MKKTNSRISAIALMTVSALPGVCAGQEASKKTWEPRPQAVESGQAHHKDSKEKLNFREENVPAYKLPDPLVSEDGKPIKTVEDWNNIRRPEILDLFRKHVYGIRPTTPHEVEFKEVARQENVYGIGAVATQVQATITAGKGTFSFDFVLVTPKSDHPVPLVVMINNRTPVSLQSVVGEVNPFWPAEKLIRRGYATACFRTSDVDPDEGNGYKRGIRALLDADDSDPMTRWHSLSAWAWGASRVLDYGLKQPGIDPERTAVVGHSRGGKAALWAGAEDPRFKLVYSNNSGCGGAALSRRAYGESVERINNSFPHWFNGNFKTYNGNEGKLPVDQHQLISLIAPRAVYVTSRDLDLWADPRGEYASLVQAGPVYGLFGIEHITNPVMPPLDTPRHVGKTGYHILTGPHNLDVEDWGHFLDFADSVFKPRQPPTESTKASERPNILFVLADDWGCGDAGAYGRTWIQTPAFDRLAREGLRFDNAYTPNAKCAPSRASVLTGRNSWQLKEAGNHGGFFPLEFSTYPEVLGKQGYFVGLTGKGWAPGTALDADGKSRPLTGRAFDQRKAPRPTTGIDTNDYAANFKDFLDAAPEDGPWCFWMGVREPHRDYEYGSGAAKAGKDIKDIERVPAYWPDTPTVRNDMLDYALEVEHFDRHLGRAIEELEKRGQLDNTLIVVTSDNGRPFPREKGNLYEAANHLPFAVMWKNGIRSPGRVVRDHVSFVDLAPTFLEAAGIPWSKSGMAPTSGISLTDVFKSGKTDTIQPERDHLLLGQERHDVGRPHDEGYPIRGIIKDGWLYSRNFTPDRWPAGNPETGYLNTDGSPTKTGILTANRAKPYDPHWLLCFGKRPAEELFDLKNDPDCVHNLAAAPEQQTRRTALEAQLLAKLKQQGDPRISGQGELFDKYPYAGAERGLYDRYLKGEKLKTGWVNPTDAEPVPLDEAPPADSALPRPSKQ